jgi:signal transduction histidine kinase
VLERARQKLTTHGQGDAAIKGLPVFLDQLSAILRHKIGVVPPSKADKSEMARSATVRGADLHKLGVTLGEVVQSYGILCDAVTDLATEGRLSIEPHEFNTLNTTLDDAIAQAVEEHNRLGDELRQEQARVQLGSLAHELRNALSSALLSLSVLKEGRVTVQSSTGKVLERSLLRLSSLIDRSLAEVRLDTGSQLHLEHFRLITLLNEVEASAGFEARTRTMRLRFELAEPELELVADRQLLLSALSNLVLNAIKYSPPGSNVTVVGCGATDHVTLEVHDQCGGIPPDKIEALFLPFVRGDAPAAQGLGLGLDIARRAIEAHHGSLRVRNDLPTGCVFTIELPHKLS